MPVKVLIATGNQGKKAEMSSILLDAGISLLTLKDFPGLPEAVEDGKTFAENARKKALHYLALTGIPVIADDSGLEVDALDGAPGVFSSRYAATDALRIERLLREIKNSLEKKPGKKRTARFACAVCLALPAGELLETYGEVRGLILEAPRGTGGFGYDPVFLYPPLNQSFAEISPDLKNTISHRANALAELKKMIQESRVKIQDSRLGPAGADVQRTDCRIDR
jgi:XTP/dITP diphosphohydrolase